MTIKKSVFGSVVVGAFQITFRAKMHANDVFSFFKNYFWHQHIKTIQNIQTILNFSKNFFFFENAAAATFPNILEEDDTAPINSSKLYRKRTDCRQYIYILLLNCSWFHKSQILPKVFFMHFNSQKDHILSMPAVVKLSLLYLIAVLLKSSHPFMLKLFKKYIYFIYLFSSLQRNISLSFS